MGSRVRVDPTKVRCMTADSFGMPIKVFGDHPDRFYCGVGRLVCLITTSRARIGSARPSRKPRLLMAAQQLLPTLSIF